MEGIGARGAIRLRPGIGLQDALRVINTNDGPRAARCRRGRGIDAVVILTGSLHAGDRGRLITIRIIICSVKNIARIPRLEGVRPVGIQRGLKTRGRCLVITRWIPVSVWFRLIEVRSAARCAIRMDPIPTYEITGRAVIIGRYIPLPVINGFRVTARSRNNRSKRCCSGSVESLGAVLADSALATLRTGGTHVCRHRRRARPPAGLPIFQVTVPRLVHRRWTWLL